MLPVGGIIVGIIALLVGGYAALQVSKVNTTLKNQEEKIAKIENIESQVNSAVVASDKNGKTINEVARQTQEGFNTLTNMLGDLRTSVTKLEEQKKPAAPVAGKKGPVEPAVAGPGEYVVKPGDNSGAKIARDHGVSLSDLMDVNPSVNWTKLKVGDKLKLPQKR